MQLELDRIRRDGGTQPRSALLLEVMDDYAELMRSGVRFPPVTVYFDGKEYWLADGFHRVGAALQVEPDGKIQAEVVQGTQSDAQWHSLGANQTHGLRRSREDCARAIKSALEHPNSRSRSDRSIAEHLGVSPSTIAKYRRELGAGVQLGHLTRRAGRDGKAYPANRACNSRRTTAGSSISATFCAAD